MQEQETFYGDWCGKSAATKGDGFFQSNWSGLGDEEVLIPVRQKKKQKS